MKSPLSRIISTAICALLIALLPQPSHSQVVTTPEDSLIFCRIMQTLRPSAKSLSSGELILKAAESLCGTPYVAGTLEHGSEVLTVNLRETDCILFVEACTAFTLLLKEDSSADFGDFCGKLRTLRYRHGTVDGYPSRLHYTSEWLKQASDLGILKEITASLGGIPIPQEFSFMTTHPENYRQLRDNPADIARIRRAEEALSYRGPYYHIPAARIPEIEAALQDGDILCFTSRTEGLDITHVGIACRQASGRMHFIHASSRAGKVIVESRPLAEYCRTGIRVARLL